MVLIAEERKAGPQLQQELCHILDQSLLNVTLYHILFERNKIEDIRIFHRLDREFALRRRKTAFKVGHLLCQHLPLIQPAFDLVDQHIAGPAVLSNLFGIPNVLVCTLYLIHQGDMVIPSNLCKRRLHNFLIGETQCEFRHIFQVSHGVAGGVRKRNFNVGGKIFNKFVSPCLVLVDDLADGVVENQQLTIDADRRTVLRRADLLLDRLDDIQVFVGIHQHFLIPSISSRSNPWHPTSTSCHVASKSSVHHGSATSRACLV